MSFAVKHILSRLSPRAAATAVVLFAAPLALPAGTPVFGVATAEAGHWHHHHRHGLDSGAAAVIGGIIGLGLGLAVGDPHYHYGPHYYDGPRPLYRVPPRRVRHHAPAPYTRAWYRYCHAKYRSFDARSGTYQPYRGHRRLCR